MKTIREALKDEIFYPIGEGYIDNIMIKRELNGDDEFTKDVSDSELYKGALADCLHSLLFSVNFSEADRSVGSLSSDDKKRILNWANTLYKSIGEKPIDVVGKPKVYICS